MANIYFENGANFITASNDEGKVIVRCNFSFTDCGETESLKNFTARHGGELATAKYLSEAYSKATKV